MSSIKSFQDLLMWQKARELAKKVHAAYTREPFCRDYALRDQVNKSSGSVMDNIAEGFERDGSREFIQFLSVSKGSAGEALSQLIRAFDRQYISADELKEFEERIAEVTRLIGGMMKHLKNSELRGSKFPKN